MQQHTLQLTNPFLALTKVAVIGSGDDENHRNLSNHYSR